MLGRWKKAIGAERRFWSECGRVLLEREEVESKYRSVIRQVERDLGVTPCWRILDVGSGPAPVSGLFGKGKRVALDPLISVFQEKKLMRALGFGGFHLIQARGENLPTKEGVIDLIVCRNVLDHVENPLKTVEEMARALKEKGVMLIAIYCYTDFIAHFKKKIEGSRLGFLREIYHPHFFTIYDFRKLCETNFIIRKGALIHEGKNPLDFGKIYKNSGAYSVNLPRFLLSFVRSIFVSSRKRGANSFKENLFVAFWYLIGFLNGLEYSWYVREYLVIAEKV